MSEQDKLWQEVLKKSLEHWEENLRIAQAEEDPMKLRGLHITGRYCACCQHRASSQCATPCPLSGLTPEEDDDEEACMECCEEWREVYKALREKEIDKQEVLEAVSKMVERLKEEIGCL